MLARAFGCKTYRIEHEAEIGPVLASAFAEQALTFVEVRTSLAAALPH